MLCSTLQPEDIHGLLLRLYTDADWNGDAATTKSTTGVWLELYNPETGHSWAVTWGTCRQSHTASSTAEAETVAHSAGLRRDALPVQLLLEELLGMVVPIQGLIDNDQAITAIRKGYSKKLRSLPR